MWQRAKPAVFLAGALALLAGVAPLQRRLTASKSPEWLQQRMSFLPKSGVLKPLLLGFHTTYANYLWFRTVNYMGTHYFTDGTFTWLVHMVDMVTKLNPRFEAAYEFAGVILPDLGKDPDAARVILERGIQHLGDHSHKPYLWAGMIELRYYEDRRKAADYIARGTRVPSEHDWKMARMAATFYHQAGAVHAAEEYLRMLLETTESPVVRRVVEDKLREVTADPAHAE